MAGKRRFWFGLVAVLGASLLAVSVHNLIFFSWVTATPAAPNRILQAERLANVWGVVVLGSTVLTVVFSVLWFRSRSLVGRGS